MEHTNTEPRLGLAALKGVKNGNCNVTACQRPGATWFNKSTRAYYCARCANEINWPGGWLDTMTLYGVPLLCEERDPEDEYRAEVVKYTANAVPVPGESAQAEPIQRDVFDVMDERFGLKVATIRGPRVGRKPTKSMKKLAKKMAQRERLNQ